MVQVVKNGLFPEVIRPVAINWLPSSYIIIQVPHLLFPTVFSDTYYSQSYSRIICPGLTQTPLTVFVMYPEAFTHKLILDYNCSQSDIVPINAILRYYFSLSYFHTVDLHGTSNLTASNMLKAGDYRDTLCNPLSMKLTHQATSNTTEISAHTFIHWICTGYSVIHLTNSGSPSTRSLSCSLGSQLGSCGWKTEGERRVEEVTLDTSCRTNSSTHTMPWHIFIEAVWHWRHLAPTVGDNKSLHSFSCNNHSAIYMRCG